MGALVWFVVAVAISTGPLDVEPSRGNLWVVGLVFLAPVAVLFIAEEVWHWIKHGSQGRQIVTRATTRRGRCCYAPCSAR